MTCLTLNWLKFEVFLSYENLKKSLRVGIVFCFCFFKALDILDICFINYDFQVIRIASRLWNATLVEDYAYGVNYVVIKSNAEIRLDPTLNIQQNRINDFFSVRIDSLFVSKLNICFEGRDQSNTWRDFITAPRGELVVAHHSCPPGPHFIGTSDTHSLEGMTDLLSFQWIKAKLMFELMERLGFSSEKSPGIWQPPLKTKIIRKHPSDGH